MEKTENSESINIEGERNVEELSKLQLIFYSIVVILTIFFLVWTIVRINIYVLIVVIILTLIYIYFDDDLTNNLDEEITEREKEPSVEEN
ncbi:MAG: hypothetical protein BAJALOKI2v1_290028 [Promethearchaeota archaeon]|nr:MAG: hypothetical protein BAJALOKI2v1_290028 [Candidatus Lokiarchaeota archaeon]